MARGRRQRRPQTQGTSCVTIHSHYACTPVFVRLFNGPISSDTCEGGVWDNLRERRSPLLGKGGDFGFPFSCFQCPLCPAKDVGHGEQLRRGACFVRHFLSTWARGR